MRDLVKQPFLKLVQDCLSTMTPFGGQLEQLLWDAGLLPQPNSDPVCTTLPILEKGTASGRLHFYASNVFNLPLEQVIVPDLGMSNDRTPVDVPVPEWCRALCTPSLVSRTDQGKTLGPMDFGLGNWFVMYNKREESAEDDAGGIQNEHWIPTPLVSTFNNFSPAELIDPEYPASVSIANLARWTAPAVYYSTLQQCLQPTLYEQISKYDELDDQIDDFVEHSLEIRFSYRLQHASSPPFTLQAEIAEGDDSEVAETEGALDLFFHRCILDQKNFFFSTLAEAKRFAEKAENHFYLKAFRAVCVPPKVLKFLQISEQVSGLEPTATTGKRLHSTPIRLPHQDYLRISQACVDPDKDHPQPWHTQIPQAVIHYTCEAYRRMARFGEEFVAVDDVWDRGISLEPERHPLPLFEPFFELLRKTFPDEPIREGIMIHVGKSGQRCG
eukprot:m.303995 g.303995  ORF g.303995 m.303995 type:complete len:442 (-) comp23010_c0_seq3:78-1403(-)